MRETIIKECNCVDCINRTNIKCDLSFIEITEDGYCGDYEEEER